MRFITRGLLIAVLLLTTGCTELKQLTQLPTEEAQHSWAIIQRQEEIQDAGGHKFFLPYITRQDPIPPPDGKHPIGGGHSMPPYTDSYYITSKDLSVLFNMGCAIGRHDLNTPGVQDNLVILDFGIPKRLSNGEFGVSLMGYGPISVYEVGELSKVFGLGYYNCSGADMESQLRVGIGTNNYGNTTNSAITYEHGAAWANMVNEVNAYFSVNTRNSIKQQVDAVGANDIELSWNSFEATKRWLDGYDSVNLYDMYNFGAIPGCGWLKNPNATCGSYPYIWDKDEVWYVIYGSKPVYPLPEIYRTDGVNAEQWYLMSVYSYQAHGVPVEFVGSLTTYQACLQVGGNECISSPTKVGINNTPAQGWNQLYKLLNGDARTAQGLRWATDILWTHKADPIPLADLGLAGDPQTLDTFAENADQTLIESLRTASQLPAVSAAAQASLQEKLEIAERLEAARLSSGETYAEKFEGAALGLNSIPVASLSLENGEEIIEGSEALVRPSMASVVNLWRGVVNDLPLQVLAGSLPEQPEQGLVIALEPSSEPGQVEMKFYLSPDLNGALRIIERQDSRLVMQAASGKTVYFDLVNKQFQ